MTALSAPRLALGQRVFYAATGVLLLGWRRGRVPLEVVVLAVGSALSLAAIDVIYVSNGTIRPVYLLDAVVEVALALAWVPAARRG